MRNWTLTLLLVALELESAKGMADDNNDEDEKATEGGKGGDGDEGEEGGRLAESMLSLGDTLLLERRSVTEEKIPLLLLTGCEFVREKVEYAKRV